MSEIFQESKDENVKKKIKSEPVSKTIKSETASKTKTVCEPVKSKTETASKTKTANELVKSETASKTKTVYEPVDYRQLSGKPMNNGIFTRLVFIGDYFLSRYRPAWPNMSKVKPYYLIKNKLSIDEVIPKFANHRFLNKKDGKGGSNILVIIMFGPHLFATYEKYKSPNCPADHGPVEFVRDVEQGKFAHKNFEKIIKGMLDIKEKLEAMGLNVLFSYLPEFNFFRRLQESFEWTRENMPRCVCECYQLPKNAAKECKVRFREGIPMINRFIYSARLNVLKGFIFEFFPLEISFENGHFKANDRTLEGKKDVFVLDNLVAKLVYGPDVYKNLSGELLRLKYSTLDCMKNMRRSILGPKANRFRLLIIGDTWLKFAMSEWNVFGKTTPFFHYENYLTFDKMFNVILALIEENEQALVVTHVPSGELLCTKQSSLCIKHTPLEYPVPQDELINSTTDFGQKLIDKITLFSENIVDSRKHCCVVFFSGYPTRFASYYDMITQEHLSGFHISKESHSNEELIDRNPSYDTKVNECLEIVNKCIYECNTKNGFETYDVFRLLMSNSEPLLAAEIIFPLYAFPRGRTTLCALVRNLFLGFQRYINWLFDHCNDDSFIFAMGGKRKAKNEVRNREAKRLKRIARENRKRNPVILGSPQFPYRIVNPAEIASADGRHIRRINPAVMTNTAYNTPVIWSNKRVNPQPPIIHAAMGETRDTHFVSDEQDYSFETRNIETEQQPILTHYQGKKSNSSVSNNLLNARGLPVRKVVPCHTDHRDITEENIEHDNVLDRGSTKIADRYESYPGINSSGYGYTVEPLYPYQAHNNSWRAKNAQKKIRAQQTAARNVYIKPIPHVSTINHSQAKFSTPHESIRNPQFLTHPGSTRNSQADCPTEPNSSRNSQTIYIDPQSSTRPPHTAYIVEQNYISNQPTHFPVGQNYSGNAEATYITPHNYSTNHQGAYAEDPSVMSNVQGNQSYGHYTIW